DPDADALSILAVQPVSALGAAVAINASQINFTPLAGGTGTDSFYYIINDTGGRPSINKVSLTVAVDTTPPDTTLTATPPNPTNDNTPTFSFTGNDNFAQVASLTYECQVDAAAYAPCSSPFTTATLADGTHTFSVRAKDQAANIDPTPASYT